MDRMEPSFDMPPHAPHGGDNDPFRRSRYYNQAGPAPRAADAYPYEHPGHDPYAHDHYGQHGAHAPMYHDAPQPHYHRGGYAEPGYHHGGDGYDHPHDDTPYRPKRRLPSRVTLIAAALVLGVWVPITINAMWMQDGPHPAPFFAGNQQAPAAQTGSETAAASRTAQQSTPREASARNGQAAPAAEPATTAAAPAPTPSVQAVSAPEPSREQRELAEIQNVLQRLGLYDGAIDGLYGPRTRAAIEAFETGHGLSVSGQPSGQLRAKLGLPAQSAPESSLAQSQNTQSAAAPAATGIAGLLDADQPPAPASDPIAQAIIDQTSKPAPTAGYTQAFTQVPAAVPAPAAPALPQPGLAPPTGVQTISITPPAPATALLSAERPRTGDPRVLHVQRLLADLAYAPGSIDGQLGPSTRAAIMRFEADRNMAQTGQVTNQLLNELAAMTGVTYDG